MVEHASKFPFHRRLKESKMKADIARRLRSAALQEQPIVAIVVDDHPISADGMKSYLETTEDIRVAAICYTDAEALDRVDDIHPDIVLLDVRLDGSRMNGIDVAQQLRLKYTHQQLKILIISAYASPQYVFGALEADVDGYIIKSSKDTEIIEAVYAVMCGVGVWDRKVQTILNGYYTENELAHDPREYEILNTYHSLTQREKEVLRLIAANCSNATIAARLVIVPGTVKQHVNNILRKLALKDRKQIQIWYRVNRSLFGQ